MGVYQNFCIGPFAEWLTTGDEPMRHPFDAVAGIEANLAYNESPLEEIAGKMCRRHCFTPIDEARSFSPPRSIYFWRPTAIVQDYSATDREGEISWFRRAYQRELDELTSFYGRPPSLKWGLVAWVSA
jgi:hypothetical protein